jgi:hypothetical protein
MPPTKIGLIGCGYWGRNYVRILTQQAAAGTIEFVGACDSSQALIKAVKQGNPASSARYLALGNNAALVAKNAAASCVGPVFRGRAYLGCPVGFEQGCPAGIVLAKASGGADRRRRRA